LSNSLRKKRLLGTAQLLLFLIEPEDIVHMNERLSHHNWKGVLESFRVGFGASLREGDFRPTELIQITRARRGCEKVISARVSRAVAD